MVVKEIKRKFVIDKSKVELADLNSQMSVEQVQTYYSAMYPELTTATAHKEFRDDMYVYTFKSVIGTKG